VSSCTNVFRDGKFRQRGGFYGKALPWRNAESEGREAAVGERGVLPLALAAEARSAGVFRRQGPAAAQAGGGEAEGEEELKIENGKLKKGEALDGPRASAGLFSIFNFQFSILARQGSPISLPVLASPENG
jgi:hypothetical protein